MADEKESAPRARPFTPPLPPFRGPATVSRPPAISLTPPEAKRGSLFVGTRSPTKTVAAATPDVMSISALAPTAEVAPPVEAPTAFEAPAEPPAWVPDAEQPASEEQAPVATAELPRADAIAATEAMPWLFTDPGASQPVGGSGVDDASAPAEILAANEPAARTGDPAVTAQPSFDAGAVTPRSQPAIDGVQIERAPSRRDAAAVLESIAARIRRGEIDASLADAASGEATVLASVLAALLRQQGR